ncbi:hypothetical protein AB4560_09675 [Vibrio sp. 10N.222.51.C12]|uniref:hypothetical protein n=1 Tax=Vibrio sp. 10N.222.51.C12 TaxID=3229622 RepID=UPI0035543D94
MKIPKLKEFKMEGVPFLLVDPSTLPSGIMAELDKFMRGKTVSHPIYIYTQDWQEFCGAVERGDIKI